VHLRCLFLFPVKIKQHEPIKNLTYNKQMNYTLKKTNWNESKQALSFIRKTVFIKEQNVPEDLEWDEFDKQCVHILVTDNHNSPIACGRIKSDGHIGRMAVLKAYRKMGIGTAILKALLQFAAEKNIKSVFLHAQITAIDFYEKQGFEICSEIFLDANIPHKTMQKQLS